MSRCWSVGRLDAISLLKSRQYAVSKSYVAATGPRPGCTASTAWGVHGVLGVKRRGKQLVREIDWHLDLGVTELETPQRDNDEYAHAQWYSAQGLCRSSQPRPLALPATPFLAGNCSSPKPRSRIPAAGPADPAFGDLPLLAAAAISRRLALFTLDFAYSTNILLTCSALALEHVQMKATIQASDLARHAGSSTTSWSRKSQSTGVLGRPQFDGSRPKRVACSPTVQDAHDRGPGMRLHGVP